MIYTKKQSNASPKIFEKSLITNLVTSLGIAFFVASLFLTSLFTSNDDIQGYWVLFIGWFGLLIFQFAWFANIVNLLALLLLSRGQLLVPFALSAFAFGLATQTFSFTEIPTGLQNEKTYIKELGLGFYLWYFAHFLFLIATLIEVFRNKKTRT